MKGKSFHDCIYSTELNGLGSGQDQRTLRMSVSSAMRGMEWERNSHWWTMSKQVMFELTQVFSLRTAQENYKSKYVAYVGKSELFCSKVTSFPLKPCHVQLFCEPMDCSPPSSSVHEISQARILEWVDISFSRGSSWPRDRNCVSCIAGKFFTTEPLGKPKWAIFFFLIEG